MDKEAELKLREIIQQIDDDRDRIRGRHQYPTTFDSVYRYIVAQTPNVNLKL